MRLEGVGHVLAELIAAGAETRLVLSEKVGLLRQGWLEVKNNENLHEAETLSKRQSAQVFLPSNKIQTLSNKFSECGWFERKRRHHAIDRCLLKDSFWSGRKVQVLGQGVDSNSSFVNT